MFVFFFFFSSRRRHTRSLRDWSSDVCSSDLVIEAWTIRHARDGGRLGIVIGRLGDGRRFVARGDDGDASLLGLLASAPDPVGERVYVRSAAAGNRVTVSRPAASEKAGGIRGEADGLAG